MNFKVSKTFSNFPVINSRKNFEDFIFEWTSMVHNNIMARYRDGEGSPRVLLEKDLNEYQQILFVFYEIDRQVRNGGFPQLMLNKETYLLYMLPSGEKIDMFENEFKALHACGWANVVYHAFTKISPLMRELFKQKHLFEDTELFYATYGEVFKEIDEYYLSHLEDFWQAFQEFVVANEKEYFSCHGS